MKFGVVVFPGSNCDNDMVHVIGEVMDCEVRKIWHKETSLDGFTKDDCIILPGGFSYGDYLRTGSIARFSPIMDAVISLANEGGIVWGICNGFQILCETGLLPGVLLHNDHQKFLCENSHLATVNHNSRITSHIPPGKISKIPIAHADGRYHIDNAGLGELEANNQILFKYCDADGNISTATNPNGSVANIAAICNRAGNVFGMMPHPERASEITLGNEDGRLLFESLLATAEAAI